MSTVPMSPPPAPPVVIEPRLWRWLAGALGLALWLAWSVCVVQLPDQGARLTPNQVTWLLALPALPLACARVLAAVLPHVVAGSPWTQWATAALLPLAVLVGLVGEHPGTPLELLLVLSLFVGIGATLFAAVLAPHGADLARQALLLRRRGTARLCLLAAGSFGNALGLLAALPLVSALHFPPTLALAWTMPLVLVLGQAAGARAAGRFGARRVTSWAFGLLALATATLLQGVLAPAGWSLGAFMAAAAAMLAASGAASGAAFRLATTLLAPQGGDSPAALGLVAAFGSFGGFAVPKALGTSLSIGGGVGAALALLLLVYLGCAALARWGFGAEARSTSSTDHRLSEREGRDTP